ncbi:MAG: peroxide stress protein YaaA, partial [Campylobacterota bacterium]|nr:peroxide stress protein YaaA [Campylobacterota bacterium]
MKILFSPSETKYKGGVQKKITKDSFIFLELYKYRLEAIKQYQDFIDKASNSELSKLFGTKKQDVIDYYKGNLLEKDTKKVIQRYNGVAFDYLEYNQLNKIEQNYIDNNVMIFSNLFGPILCGDDGIPDYKLKQNEKLDKIALEKFYKNNFSDAIDNYLE